MRDRASSVFLLLPLLAAQVPGEPSPRPETELAFTIAADDPPLEGHGPAAIFEHVVGFSGTLHVWARAEADLFLRVEDQSDGRVLAEDEDSGGGTTPCVGLTVEPGTALAVFVAARGQFASGALHLVAAPETEATRAAAALADESLAEVARLLDEGEHAHARERIAGLVEGLLGVPGAEESELVAEACWKVARVAQDAESVGPQARVLELVERHRSRTLPVDHLALQRARGNLAILRRQLGDQRAARTLEEGVLACFERSLPPEHPLVQSACNNLAVTLSELGELDGARALNERVLAIRTRTLPEGHGDLWMARKNLAGTLATQGDLRGAHALYEQVFRAAERTLADGDPELELERMNLAVTTSALGDPRAALVMLRRVVEALERALPDDHPSLQEARLDLADVLADSGDRTAARALQERVLEELARSLPADHSRLQLMRLHMADTLSHLGDLAGARVLQEKALENYASALSGDNPDLQMARTNLAVTLKEQGELERARALEREVIESYSRTLGGDDPELQRALCNLADTEFRSGEFERARTRWELALASLARALPDDHPDLLQVHNNLAVCVAALDDGGAFDGHARALAQGLEQELRDAVLSGSPRELEERTAALAGYLSALLCYARGFGSSAPDAELERQAFRLVELARSASMAAASPGTAPDDAETSALRARVREASAELTRLARGTGTRDQVAAAVARRDRAQDELRARLAARSDTSAFLVEPSVEALAGALRPGHALLGYWRYARSGTDPRTARGRALSASLLAFVLRDDGELRRIELGPLAPIEAAVGAWRAALQAPLTGVAAERGVAGASAAISAPGEEDLGRQVRALVFDPVRAALGDARGLIVALDDVLHAVPLDALPDGEMLLGDRFQIELRPTLREILWPARPSLARLLVALGGAAFDASPSDQAVVEGAAEAGAPPSARDARARFADLPFTAVEARRISDLLRQQAASPEIAVLLEGTRASRRALEELAPKARWLHLATHGWFAPELGGIRTRTALDAEAGILASTPEERVLGASPLVLCGLALAGANLPADGTGRCAGLVSAEELSTWDLTQCELAVLSACETGAGVRRAGQGVSSLQKALRMAGARSVIASLWKVPDEATQELMSDFYRRLWVEKKSRRLALWEAKASMRAARDSRGMPLHSTRDWAGWVLLGDPE